MAKLGTVEVQCGPILSSLLEQQSKLLVDRDKYKTLYEASQAALTEVLRQLTEIYESIRQVDDVLTVNWVTCEKRRLSKSPKRFDKFQYSNRY